MADKTTVPETCTIEEREAWDRYCCAALSGHPVSAESAAKTADAVLGLRRERFGKK